MSNLMAPGNPTTRAGEQKPTKPKGPTHREVAELAYRYWKERGSPHGDDWADWLDAEEDLLEEESEEKEGE